MSWPSLLANCLHQHLEAKSHVGEIAGVAFTSNQIFLMNDRRLWTLTGECYLPQGQGTLLCHDKPGRPGCGSGVLGAGICPHRQWLQQEGGKHFPYHI